MTDGEERTKGNMNTSAARARASAEKGRESRVCPRKTTGHFISSYLMLTLYPTYPKGGRKRVGREFPAVFLTVKPGFW